MFYSKVQYVFHVLVFLRFPYLFIVILIFSSSPFIFKFVLMFCLLCFLQVFCICLLVYIHICIPIYVWILMHSIPPFNTALIHLTAIHTYPTHSRYRDSRYCSSFSSYWKKKLSHYSWIFSIFDDVIINSRLLVLNTGIITNLILCKGNVSWPTLRHNPVICMERVKESQQKTFRVDSVPTAGHF
jgi:hypothetical protein